MKKTKILKIALAGALAFALFSCSGAAGGGGGSVNLTEDDPIEAADLNVLPEGTSGTAGTSATYVEYGSYPQSAKGNSVTVDENESKQVGMYTYYKGSDGEWYAKVYSTYYKVEPIKWRVLTENYKGTGKKLLLAEDILINCAFYDYKVKRTISGSNVYPNNYEYSRIRAFLNGYSYKKLSSLSDVVQDDAVFNGKGFLQTAFTEDEQNHITNTIIDNSEVTASDSMGSASTEPHYVCNNTKDKMFLLSKSEITNSSYGFTMTLGSYDNQDKLTTDFAKANGTSTHNGYNSSYSAGQGNWLLRSPYNDYYVEGSTSNGLYALGIYWTGGIMSRDVTDDNIGGVVPAICVY